MAKPRVRTEREMMWRLIKQYGFDCVKVCRAFANAERKREIVSNRNAAEMTPEEYAIAVWRDGEENGWLRDQRA